MTYSVKSESWGWSQDRVTSLSRTPAILRFLVNSDHYSLVRIQSVANPDPSQCCASGFVIQCLLTPGSGIWNTGWVKNQDPDLGLTSLVTFPRAQKLFFGLKFLNFWCGSRSGSFWSWIRDGKNSDLINTSRSESYCRIWIRIHTHL